jgi:hypothetical protein
MEKMQRRMIAWEAEWTVDVVLVTLFLDNW